MRSSRPAAEEGEATAAALRNVRPRPVPRHRLRSPRSTTRARADPADLNSANAGAMADALYATFIVPFDLAELATGRGLAPRRASLSISCRRGRTAAPCTGPGRTATNDLGLDRGTLHRVSSWHGDATLDGLLLDEFVQAPSPSNGQRHEHRLGFSDLRIRAPDADLTFGGTLHSRPDGRDVGSRSVVQRTVLIRDNVTGHAFYAQNFNVARSVAVTGNHALSGSGRVFDSRYGYIDVQAAEPWHFRVNESIPHHGAAWRGVGPSTSFTSPFQRVTIGFLFQPLERSVERRLPFPAVLLIEIATVFWCYSEIQFPKPHWPLSMFVPPKHVQAH